jgi:hypothetical protein
MVPMENTFRNVEENININSYRTVYPTFVMKDKVWGKTMKNGSFMYELLFRKKYFQNYGIKNNMKSPLLFVVVFNLWIVLFTVL